MKKPQRSRGRLQRVRKSSGSDKNERILRPEASVYRWRDDAFSSVWRSADYQMISTRLTEFEINTAADASGCTGTDWKKGRTSLDISGFADRRGCATWPTLGPSVDFEVRGYLESSAFDSVWFRVFGTLPSINQGWELAESGGSARGGVRVTIFSFAFETVQAIDHNFDPIGEGTGFCCERDRLCLELVW